MAGRRLQFSTPEAPRETGPLQRLDSASPATDEKKLLIAMSGLSRQMTRFFTEVNQQLAEIKDTVTSLVDRLESLESNHSCADEPKRKRRQSNPKIAEAVRSFHNSDSNNTRYDPQQGLSSSYNAGVTSMLVGTLQASPRLHGVDNEAIVSACKTYYETVRRNFRYSQPDLADRAAALKTSARCRSRRKRLLEARQSVLEAEEVAFWKGVTVDLMSDEEDGDFEGMSGWIVRPPSFRSQELTDLCCKLQKRLEMNPKYSSLHHRRLCVGPYSQRKPPLHGPEVEKHYIS